MKWNWKGKAVVVGLSVTLIAAIAVSQNRPWHGRGGRGFEKHMLEFFTDYLDLTADQQAQAKQIVESGKTTMQPLMEQMKSGHLQMRQLEESSTFDEAKVRVLASQQAQTMTEMIVQKAKIKSQLFAILTADQKAKLQKFEEKRHQHMMEHMPGPDGPGL
jgi:protein CpxP